MLIFQTVVLLYQFSLGILQEIPYREEATYKLSLKMEFKVEPTPPATTVEMVQKRHNTEPQLFLNASLELLTLMDEDYRLKVINNDNNVLISRKLKSIDAFVFKLGYASHMKDKTAPHIFTVQFFNKDREVTSQIILEVKANGDFMVNGKRFGKV